MFRGFSSFVFMWLLLPGQPDIGFGQPPMSPVIVRLETMRGEFWQALARASEDLHAHRVQPAPDCTPK